MQIYKYGAVIVSCMILSACSSTSKVNHTAPPPDEKPHIIDQELRSKTQELLEEVRALALIRQAKAKGKSQTSQDKISAGFSGLDKRINFDCSCDLKVNMQALAVNLGWDANRVYEVGHKPAMGVPVEIKLRQEPISLALEQLEVQVGHFVDIRIDPNFKSILITYQALDAPREAHQ
ncbi:MULTISPECIES: DotD/TraH family lipoprotein [Vibrio]|uniref:DotD/TraH family lipoprotein n=1 Tax=Vibrio TaxID=662 RepID=UPI001E4B6AB8|nr:MULTISPECIES: DotD/TraH family lipoprotein [Vibrio]MCC2524955.1 DotD/TraH family lipoprotein [Vibrio coralliilyticus]USD35500.1 DotD/TraH family lipoprotein [Vibrio sp. SCSIO 43186]USD72624.1 DotD/TraH family lipoprotein [Vibrio sp. SCSIO 43139]USD99015.1 hypothetical protein CTT30_23365 [Vibrio coralliilyticus]